MSNRTITHVSFDGKQAVVTLSDGSAAETGGFPSLGFNAAGVPNYGVALRDAAGTLAGEVAPLTYDVAKMFEAAGVTGAEVMGVIARGPDAPEATEGATSAEPAAPVPEPDAPPVQPTATETIDVVSLPQAKAAPMTQQSAPDTHVVVHGESVSAIARLLEEAKDGVEGALEKLAHAFAHVFHHGSAS